MALIKFIGNWSKDWQKQIPKGYLLIKPKETYHKKIAIVLNKLDQMQQKKEELKDIDITIEVHYKKRTLDQNNLMWALYEIESNELNAGMKGSKEHMFTSQELYDNDIKDYAPKIEIRVKHYDYKNRISFLKSQYRIEKEDIIKDESGKIKYHLFTAIITSSNFTTKQMAEWVDMIFNRMALNGVTVTNPGEIHSYWVKWKQSLNDNKIILHDDILTESEYRTLNPMCEACSKFIADGSGQISHIKSRGSGGQDYASNLLHLCNECHIETQHAKGFEHFLKVYPHLTYKVSTALRRDYPTTEDKTTVDNIKDIFKGE